MEQCDPIFKISPEFIKFINSYFFSLIIFRHTFTKKKKNLFQAFVSFSFPLKKSENQMLSDVSEGYRKYLTVSGHSLSTYAKFSEKLTFLVPLIRTRTCAYQEVRNVCFSENFAYVFN